MVPDDRLVGIDRYVLALYGRLASELRRAYEQYDFQAMFHAVNEFMTVDLSAFYLDISKDRLYTLARRFARTPVGADGAVRDRRWPDQVDCASAVVHR